MYGPIFSIRLGTRHAAVLLGPEYNRLFFAETDKCLSMREVYRWLIPMFGDKLVFVAEEDEYREQKAIVWPALEGRKLAGYVGAMEKETMAWLDALGHEGAFDLIESFGRLTMFIAARAFLGENFRKQMGDEFWGLFRDLAGGVEFVLPSNLPLRRFRRRDRARIKLHALISEIINERRIHHGHYDDFLQVLIESRYSNGDPLPDHLIINMILGLIFAGHETTLGHGSWALVQLLQHPDYLARVLEEQEAILDARTQLDLDTLVRLQRMDWALKETERMRPVAQLLMRYTKIPYDVGGYRIPQGWLTLVPPALSHRLPDVFREPDCYDPDRFSRDRAEDRKAAYSLIGFGGGKHKCVGMRFAFTEMKVILSLLLQRYRLELVNPDPRPIAGPTSNRPESPCFVRYQERL
jgi:sterol 14-demethylase